MLREDAYVSPRHLRLVRREEGWYAKDLGSVNGIYLRLRRAHALLDGDLLVIGRGDPTISDNMRGVATTVMDSIADLIRAHGIRQVTGSPHPVSVKITFLFQPWVPVVRDASGNGVTFSAQTTMETEY